MYLKILLLDQNTILCILLQLSEGKRPLGRRRHRWEDNIKMNLQECDGETWTGLIWLRIGTGGGRL
jgi:hypothetical protein